MKKVSNKYEAYPQSKSTVSPRDGIFGQICAGLRSRSKPCAQ